MKLSKAILTSDRILVPAGTELHFDKSGKAKYQNHVIERKFVPLECIVGAKGPFMHACVATVLNDNKKLQEVRKTDFKDWAHCITYGNVCFVYIWDTREVIDVITGLNSAVAGKVHTRTLVSKQTGQRVTQYLGQDRTGWAKSLFEMMTWPAYHRPDNGLPLVTKNKDWQELVKKLNDSAIKAEAAYEAFDETKRDEYAKHGLAMPDGSYPITDIEDLENAIKAYGRAKDKAAVKAFIIRRAHELNAVDKLPEAWLDAGVEAGELTVIPAQVANTHLVMLDNIEVASITAQELDMQSYGYEKPDAGDSTETTDNPDDTEEPGEPREYLTYKNTKKNKLIVIDNAGKIMQLKCLNEDFVKLQTLLDEIAAAISAKENLSQDLFKNYDDATGKQYVHDFKVIYVSDLFDLCQLLADIKKVKPIIDFHDDNTVQIETRSRKTPETGELTAMFNFDHNLCCIYCVDKSLANIVAMFVKQHFGKNLEVRVGD